MAFIETAARNSFELSDQDVAEMTEEQRRCHGIGMAVYNLISMKVLPGGRVHTSWGSKTALGLGRSILTIVEDNL